MTIHPLVAAKQHAKNDDSSHLSMIYVNDETNAPVFFDDNDKEIGKEDKESSPPLLETAAASTTTLRMNGNGIIPNPPRLQRNTLHVQPGAYRVHRNGILALTNNNNVNDNDGEEDRRGEADDHSNENASTFSREDRHPANGASRNSSPPPHDGDNHQEYDDEVVVTLEAELVDHQVVKAEPMRNRWCGCNTKYVAILIFSLIAIILVLVFFLIPRRTPPNRVFSYYTHHSVQFAASENSTLRDLNIVLKCGNGAVVVKDVFGPCDERNGDDSLECHLGNVFDYDRHIFFSCGSNTIIDAPSATVSAMAVGGGTGLLYLCLFQLCQEGSVKQDTTCGPNATLIQFLEQDQQQQQQEEFSLCSSSHDDDMSTGVSVTNLGVTCPADQPFAQSPDQTEFASRKQQSILRWLRNSTTTTTPVP